MTSGDWNKTVACVALLQMSVRLETSSVKSTCYVRSWDGFLPFINLSKLMNWLVSCAIGVASLAASGCATSAALTSAQQAGECFDVLVLAKVAGQVPSDTAQSDDGYIIMSWPYFIDLNIDRVIEGQIEARTITALSVQHTYWRSDLGARKWWLRRNTVSGYNILRIEDGAKLPKCPQGAAPDRAYLEPGPGQTLDDMRRAGEQRYGSRP